MSRCRSVRSLRRIVCQLAAGAAVVLASSAAGAQPAPAVRIVADAECPVSLGGVTLATAPTGVSITYSIRNHQKQAAREVVLTAAAVNFLGEVVSLRMKPVAKKIAGGDSQQFTIIFPDLDVKDADAVSVGVQAVRWSGRRAEWRTALRVSGPTVLAAKE